MTSICCTQNKKRNDKGYSIGSNPVLWLMSLEVFLRTLCKAGSYLVNDPEDTRSQEEINISPQVPNIPRKYIEDNLAICRSFILEWTTRSSDPSKAVVLS